jgi:hypothetical protein
MSPKISNVPFIEPNHSGSAWLRRDGRNLCNWLSEARYAKRFLRLLYLIEQGKAISPEIGDSTFFHQSIRPYCPDANDKLPIGHD